MNNEKNTQNAVAPTNDTRQYKHTPSKKKHLVGKIFALVGCLAVLLSCLSIPTFADTITPGVEVSPVPKPFHMPSIASLPYSTSDGGSSVFTYTIPYSINWSIVDGNTIPPSYDYFVEYERGDFNLQLYNEVGLDTQHGSYYYYAEITGADALQNDDHVVLFEYDPFNYDSSVRASLPGTSNTAVNNFTFGWNMGSQYNGEDYTVYIDYDMYCEIPTDDGWREVNYNLEYERVHNSGYAWDSIELDNFFRDCGIINDTFRVNALYVTVSAPLTAMHITDIIANYTLPPEPTISGVIQVINSRNFTDVLDWLGDALAGLFSTTLFNIGNLEISIGLICASVLGLILIPVFLKFFSGG